MRRWWFSLGYILAILIFILLLLPLLLGLLVENKCNQIAAIINTTTPFDLKITDYQRSWFSADATAKISLDKLELPDPELHQLTIIAHITHGPIILDWQRCQFLQAKINAGVNLNSAQNTVLKRAASAGPVATINIKFDLSGATNINFASVPLAYYDQENHLLWHGLTMQTSFSPIYNQSKSKIEFSGLDLKTKDLNFQLGKITSLYHGSETSNGLWIGERNLEFQSFTNKNDNNRTTSFEKLTIHNNITNEQKNLVNIATTITLDKLNLNGSSYEQNKLDYEINQLHALLVGKLQQQLISTKALLAPQTLLQSHTIMDLISSGSEIKIKQLNTNTPWGKLLASISIIFTQPAENKGFLATITNSTINTAIQAERSLAVHLLEKLYQTLSLPKQSNNPTEQAEILLHAWQQSGKITTSDRDNYLHLIFDYKDGQPSLNHKPLTISTKL